MAFLHWIVGQHPLARIRSFFTKHRIFPTIGIFLFYSIALFFDIEILITVDMTKAAIAPLGQVIGIQSCHEFFIDKFTFLSDHIIFIVIYMKNGFGELIDTIFANSFFQDGTTSHITIIQVIGNMLTNVDFAIHLIRYLIDDILHFFIAIGPDVNTPGVTGVGSSGGDSSVDDDVIPFLFLVT